MKLLITGADRPMGAMAAERLAGRHELRLVGRTGHKHIQEIDLRDEHSVAQAVAGVDAILHLAFCDPAPRPGPDGEQDLIHEAGLGTYLLGLQARMAGINRMVLGSTLAMFDAYDQDYLIDELWRPWPDTDAAGLAPFLAERVARELALEGPNEVTCLRLGEVGRGPGQVLPEVLADAIEAALERHIDVPGRRWDVYHVSSDNRFITRNARLDLGISVGRTRP